MSVESDMAVINKLLQRLKEKWGEDSAICMTEYGYIRILNKAGEVLATSDWCCGNLAAQLLRED